MFAPNPLKNPSKPSFFHVFRSTARMAFLLFFLLSCPAMSFVVLDPVVDEPWIRVLTL